MDLKGPLFIINSEAIYKAKKKLQNNGKFDGSFTHTQRQFYSFGNHNLHYNYNFNFNYSVFMFLVSLLMPEPQSTPTYYVFVMDQFQI